MKPEKPTKTRKEEIIMETETVELPFVKAKAIDMWLIEANTGVIYTDSKGDHFISGSPSISGAALFRDRKEAQRIARMIKRKWEVIEWTKVTRCWIIKT